LLWEALRAKRREIADNQEVPPYQIFHDATLMAMMENKPTTLEQMAQLSGVGQRKLDLYGEQFLAIIQAFFGDTAGFTNTVAESLRLFRLGVSVQKIAETREFKDATIYGHLAEAIAQGLLNLNDVLDLSEPEIKQIEASILALLDEQQTSLKPVYEQFEEVYNYGILRCVQAALQYQIEL
jgi:ATP-dependent DNA helicase RecQ